VGIRVGQDRIVDPWVRIFFVMMKVRALRRGKFQASEEADS
jgi:hypothetical protein